MGGGGGGGVCVGFLWGGKNNKIKIKNKKNIPYVMTKKKLNSGTDKVNIESELKIITELELNQLLEKADLDKGKTFVNKNCASCHDLNMPIKNKIGPSLATILERKIGNLSDYKYSKTLLNIDKKWNIVNLYYFLEKPKEWAPGTKMSYRGISDSQKLINTIKYLRKNSISNEN